MREIKFRGYYKPLKRFIEPEYLESIDLETKVVGVYMELDGRGYHKLRMSDFELMQYTGLKDLYEDDIIQDNLGMGRVVYSKSKAAFMVIYQDGHRKWFIDFTDEELKTIEKLGDIHSNPELLKT